MSANLSIIKRDGSKAEFDKLKIIYYHLGVVYVKEYCEKSNVNI